MSPRPDRVRRLLRQPRYIRGGSLASLDLAALLDDAAVTRWIEIGPEAGLGFIVYRTPDETTPIADIGALSSDMPGIHVEVRREARSELANETVLLVGVVWH